MQNEFANTGEEEVQGELFGEQDFLGTGEADVVENAESDGTGLLDESQPNEEADPFAEREHLIRLEQEKEQLATQLEQLQQAAQDPSALRWMLERAEGAQQQQQAEPDISAIAEEFGLGEDLGAALGGFLEKLGYLRKGDPTLRQAENQILQLSQQNQLAQEQQILSKYKGTKVSDYVNPARQLVANSGGAISFEQALHAASNGQLAAEAAQAKVQARARQKQQASVPSTPSRSVAPAQRQKADRSAGYGQQRRLNLTDAIDSFYEAGKERNIDIDQLFRKPQR